jgi:hypothetical protein
VPIRWASTRRIEQAVDAVTEDLKKLSKSTKEKKEPWTKILGVLDRRR